MSKLTWIEYKAYREDHALEVSSFRYLRYLIGLEGLDTPP